MDAKQTLIIALKALIEIKVALPKNTLVDLLTGKENKEIQDAGYDETDAFGAGEGQDEDFWHYLLDCATEAGYVKMKTTRKQSVSITPEGKKYLKAPVPFELKDEDDFNEDIKDDGIDDIVNSALKDKKAAAAPNNSSSPRTRQQIKIIQAVDRKIALDDFAESQGIGIDEILDELEELVHMKMHIDITYFTNEVLGESNVKELMDFFESSKDDSIDNALAEYGDVYNAQEIRLARIVHRSSKL